MTVELGTFRTDGGLRLHSRGLSCAVVNGTKREITVWKGYDGTRNQLLSGAPHRIGLFPAQAPEPRRVTVGPGLSETIFRLPVWAIFFLDPGAGGEDWRWAWAGQPPRGVPSVSPFHGRRSLGWEVRQVESATVAASVEVDGTHVESKPLEIQVPLPKVETVEVLAPLESGRVIDTARSRRYELKLTVLEAHQGNLTPEEQTLVLPSRYAEPLMTEAGARGASTYSFGTPPMLLTFARVTIEGERTSRLVLVGYERGAASGRR